MIAMFGSVFLLLGGFFALIAALGVLRFGDFFARIHAATKASTFGFGFSALAAALALGTVSAWVKVMLAIVLLYMTLPVAAHLLARSVAGAGRSRQRGGGR